MRACRRKDQRDSHTHVAATWLLSLQMCCPKKAPAHACGSDGNSRKGTFYGNRRQLVENVYRGLTTGIKLLTKAGFFHPPALSVGTRVLACVHGRVQSRHLLCTRFDPHHRL